MHKTIYLCYFGVREPLVQTQVLPYLRELTRKGDFTGQPTDEASAPLLNPGGELGVSLLTFEPARNEKDRAEFEKIKENLAAEGIEWEWLPYHKRFSAVATAWDIFRGTVYIWRRIGRFDILHARVHVPMLMAALARKLSRHTPKLLFDIRGFFPEEYTDAGIWPEGGWLYRGAKRVERWLLKESDGFVVLTEKARDILFPESRDAGCDKLGRPVEVIPCCVDFQKRFSFDRELFRDSIREELNLQDSFVIVHLGALGGLYLTEEIANFLAAAKRSNPRTFALILSQTDTKALEARLKDNGLGDGHYLAIRVLPSEVERYLIASDVGLSFVKSSYATQSRSPTKIPEYLVCGLPVISNRDVGDVNELIGPNRVGVLLNEFTPSEYKRALDELESLGDVSERCREVAVKEFDLDRIGGPRYRKLYTKLLESSDDLESS